jgi:hypothetical protein
MYEHSYITPDLCNLISVKFWSAMHIHLLIGWNFIRSHVSEDSKCYLDYWKYHRNSKLYTHICSYIIYLLEFICLFLNLFEIVTATNWALNVSHSWHKDIWELWHTPAARHVCNDYCQVLCVKHHWKTRQK